jgi:hypothetical protein
MMAESCSQYAIVQGSKPDISKPLEEVNNSRRRSSRMIDPRMLKMKFLRCLGLMRADDVVVQSHDVKTHRHVRSRHDLTCHVP